MQRGQYMGANFSEEPERERLGVWGELFDSISRRHIEALGIQAGWRCLEVGAGRGSMAQWMAERVGPSGQVVAADINPRFLREAQFPNNVEVRECDIRKQDLEPHSYDLVYCRALLPHLPDPELALGRMAAAVRRGGWLLIEEPDFSLFGAADPHYPGAEEFDRTSRLCWDALRSTRIADAYFGRRTPVLVERLGFESCGYECAVLVGRGGDHPLGRLYSLTFQPPDVEAFFTKGIVTQAEYDQMRALFEDSSFEFVGPAIFGAWGRRPSRES